MKISRDSRKLVRTLFDINKKKVMGIYIDILNKPYNTPKFNIYVNKVSLKL